MCSAGHDRAGGTHYLLSCISNSELVYRHRRVRNEIMDAAEFDGVRLFAWSSSSVSEGNTIERLVEHDTSLCAMHELVHTACYCCLFASLRTRYCFRD